VRIALLTTDNRENFRRYELPDPYFGTAPQGLIQGFANLQGIEVHVVSCTQKLIPAPEKLADNIWFHSLHVPKIGWLRTGYQGCIRAVRKKLREIQPDIVHAQGTERDCAQSAVFTPYPKVLTIHGNMRLIAQFFQARPWSMLGLVARLEQFSIPRFDGVVCISSYTENAVKSLARKTWLLPNAADESFFPIVSRPVTPPEIIYVATVDPRKNQNAFLDAIAPLAERHDFRVRFFGELNEQSDFGRGFRERLSRFPWASYEGMLDRPRLRERFTTASVLVLASHEDNCPMTILEAMAAGVPAIGSRVGGIPDLIQDEENGLLCDQNDANSMQSAVERLLESPTLRESLAKNAAQSARQRFHPTVIAENHLRIYREVIAATC